MKTEVEEEILAWLRKIEAQVSKSNRPLNFVEAAKYLSISQSHLYRLTSKRKIPHYKPSGKYLYFDVNELDAWIKRINQSEITNDEETECDEPP